MSREKWTSDARRRGGGQGSNQTMLLYALVTAAGKSNLNNTRFIVNKRNFFLAQTNQGNVALKIDKHDKKKPLEMHQVSMNLLSTERKQLNPEDEIGNIKSSKNDKDESAQQKTTTTTTIKAQRRKAAFPDDDHFLPVNVKTVRLIAPMPKASARPDDADSGISSLAASFVY